MIHGPSGLLCPSGHAAHSLPAYWIILFPHQCLPFPQSLLSLFSFVFLSSLCVVPIVITVLLFTNRNTKLEECGACFGQKTPARQESFWWVWWFIVCPALYENGCPAVWVSLHWAEVWVCLRSQTRSLCSWCGTARCRWRSKTWTNTARKESRSQPKWESSSIMTEPTRLYVCILFPLQPAFQFMSVFFI